MSTLVAFTAGFHDTRYSFYHTVLVKLYCDVITRSRLQLINTSIDTFFSKLHAFLVEQRRRRKAYKRKLDGAVGKSSAYRRKLDVTCEKSGGLHLADPVLQQAGWLTKFGRGLKF